ncbi:hypothetical protein [Kocuria rosea]|uniref:hypothetical protein n=1 Tax=Kocuria rosea TaxID=1275 RepID=UPI000F84CFFB|nr:hypothetical protein [Kocuria rosea]
MFDSTFLAALVAATTAVLSVVVGHLAVRRTTKAEQEELEALSQWERIKDAWLTALPEGTSISRREAGDKALSLTHLEERVRILERRLTSIESRFPERGTIEKLESVNDAVLATQFENLSKQVDRLDQNAMSTGKVTSIVLAFVSALAALLAVSTWVLSQLAS